MHFEVTDFGLERERHAARDGCQELDAHGSAQVGLLGDDGSRRSRLAAEARDGTEHVVERHEREPEREHREPKPGDFPNEMTIRRIAHGSGARGVEGHPRDVAEIDHYRDRGEQPGIAPQPRGARSFLGAALGGPG